MSLDRPFIAVIGAGPAGLFATRELARAGATVVLFNRDLKPGGLAEYGIFHTKHRMKEGLRKQFRRILADENVHYFGNVVIGEQGDFSLNDLREMGFHAILVTVGAQGTKWLGLPGEDLEGVYHAKDLVYHYNHLPPFSEREFRIGQRAALIGAGNVMADIAHWLIRDKRIAEVTAVVRRGPAEVKFTKAEFEHIAANLDLDAFEQEIARVADAMRAVGQDPDEAKAFILSALERAEKPVFDTRFRFRFLSSPKRILGDENGRVRGLEVEENELYLDGDRTHPRGTGRTVTLDVDTVVFCIGDRVDETFGLPVAWNEFVKHPEPRFPVNGNSYEAYDPEKQQPIEGVFVAGWARKASSGLVGVARKDGENGAKAVLAYLESLGDLPPADPQRALERIRNLPKPVVTKEHVAKLEEVERAEAEKRGLPEFKFDSNAEMLRAMGLL